MASQDSLNFMTWNIDQKEEKGNIFKVAKKQDWIVT